MGSPILDIDGVTEGVSENALQQTAFQIGSLLDLTGYATSDFAQWDTNAQMVLLFAMFIGGCAGSTGGGVKIVWWLVILKTLRQELFLTVHPSAVRPVRLAGTVVDEDVIRGLFAFTFLYLFLFGFSVVFISLY